MATHNVHRVIRFTLPVICIIMYFFLIGHSRQDGAYRCGTEEYELKGILVYIVGYGPPGYGKTPEMDRKERFFALELKRPIEVLDDKGDKYNATYRDVKLVQLLDEVNINAGELIDRRVAVRGSLLSPQSSRHHTDVLMRVADIELLPAL